MKEEKRDEKAEGKEGMRQARRYENGRNGNAGKSRIIGRACEDQDGMARLSGHPCLNKSGRESRRAQALPPPPGSLGRPIQVLLSRR